MSTLVIYIVIYILILFALSYYVSRNQDKEDFLISGRNRKGWQILFSKFAASAGVGWFITYTGFAYEYGLGIFAMLSGILAGYLVLAYWASPKISGLSRENKFYTVGDFVYHKTKSKFSKYLSDILSSIILLGWLIVGIIGGSKIINDFGVLSYSFAVIISSLVILVYLLIAGHKAVILTDVFQSIIILILLFVVTFGIVGGDIKSSLVTESSIDVGVALSFFLFGLLSIFSYSNIYQLIYSAGSDKSAKHGLGLSVIPIIITGFFLMMIGVFMGNLSPEIEPGLAFTRSLEVFLNPSLLPLAIVLFLAGVMSSADTNIYSISSHYGISRKGDKMKNVRNASIFLVAFTAVISIAFPDVVDVSIIAGGISLTLSVAMIYLIAGGRRKERFIGSVAGALIGLIAGLSYFGIEPMVAIFVLIGSILGLFYKMKYKLD